MAPPRNAVELFLSLSASAALCSGAIAPIPQAQAQPHHPGSPLAQGSAEGGEGGEGSRGAAAGSHEELLLVLAQMQGHLRVAEELLQQGLFSGAEPHVGHPVDELYGALEPALRQRQVPPFLPTLEALRQQVRLNPGAASTALKLARARRAIDEAAAAGVPAEVRANPDTIGAVVRLLGQSAASEVAAAVAGDRVVELIEYQDARGFLLEARRLITSARIGSASEATPLSHQSRTVEAMLQALPGALPPARLRLSVSRLEELAQQL